MLDEKVKGLALEPNYAVVTTVMPDGSLQTLPLWVDADDEHILLNTEVHRQRYKNVHRDSHVTVLLLKNGNWFNWAEVRGRFVGEVRGDEARAHIDKLSQKYNGTPYMNPIQSERVILKIVPEHQNSW